MRLVEVVVRERPGDRRRGGRGRCPVGRDRTRGAAARLHLNGADGSKQVIVVGDTLNDIACGRSIGARCVAVATGHTTADALRAGTPDVLVETLDDLDPIVALLND